MKKIILIFLTVTMVFSQETISKTEAAKNTGNDGPLINKYIDSFFNGKNIYIEELLASDDPEINGFIRNIQVAPFNKAILSFEAYYEDSETVKVFIYNTRSLFLYQVTSAIDNSVFILKDKGVRWHPEKNWFVFYGNGRMQRNQIYLAEIEKPQLMEENSVKVHHVDLDNDDDVLDYCQYPTLNASGKKLIFSIKKISEKNARKYRPNYNIAVVDDIFEYADDDFKEVEYEFMFRAKYDQINPVCSPTDPDVFAFISYKKPFKKDYGYASYSLVVYNTETEKGTTVEKLNGFRDYEYQWNSSGNLLFYYAAHSLSATPKKFKDERINILNLKAARITKAHTKTVMEKQNLYNENEEAEEKIIEVPASVEILKNASSDIILGDVISKNHGLAFVDDNRFLISKYDPYNSIFMVNIEEWKKGGFYIKKLPINKDIDLPILTDNALLYVRYDYYKDTGTLTTICRIKAPQQ